MLHSFLYSKNHIFVKTFFIKLSEFTQCVLPGIPNKIINFRLLLEPDLLERILAVATS